MAEESIGIRAGEVKAILEDWIDLDEEVPQRICSEVDRDFLKLEIEDLRDGALRRWKLGEYDLVETGIGVEWCDINN